MFRILTEDIHRAIIYRILLEANIDGYTVTEVNGTWRGQWEKTLAIDIVGEPESLIEAVAKRIRLALGQEAVLVIKFEASHKFITAD